MAGRAASEHGFSFCGRLCGLARLCLCLSMETLALSKSLPGSKRQWRGPGELGGCDASWCWPAPGVLLAAVEPITGRRGLCRGLSVKHCVCLPTRQSPRACVAALVPPTGVPAPGNAAVGPVARRQASGHQWSCVQHLVEATCVGASLCLATAAAGWSLRSEQCSHIARRGLGPDHRRAWYCWVAVGCRLHAQSAAAGAPTGRLVSSPLSD